MPGSALEYTNRGKVSMPQEDRIMVDKGDWSRIRRNVARLGDPLTEHATTWSATAVGIFFTCIVTIITLYVSGINDAPVIVLFSVLSVASAAFAVCFYLVGKSQEAQHHTSVANVCEDMDDVAERCGRPELRGEPLHARPEPSLRGQLGWRKGPKEGTAS